MKECNEDRAICAKCGGRCCKQYPGIVSPQDGDFVALLDSGRYAIDWWEGDARYDVDELTRTYFIRPRIKGYEDLLLHPAWGGECTFLGSTGCELSYKDRPFNCRDLEPLASGNCSYTLNKRQTILLWLPFQESIFRYIKAYTKADVFRIYMDAILEMTGSELQLTGGSHD